MRRRRRFQARFEGDSQTSVLQGLEFGLSVPSRFVFRSELASLRQLHFVENGLHPLNFSHGRHAYITQLVPSTDKALLAIASSDGHVEVHEPADKETLRLKIFPIQGKKLASLAWGCIGSADCLIFGLNENSVALYDLNTCQANRPTWKFSYDGRSLSDVTTLDNSSFAAAIPNRIQVYDARVRTSIACIATGNRDAVLTGEDIFIYAADNGEIALWDRRKLDSPSTSGFMKKRQDAALSRRSFASGRFNDICVIPGSAPGSIFFHLANGTAGHVDMVGHRVESIPEVDYTDKFELPGETGLDPYGTLARSLEFPWYVQRRRIDIIRARHNSGWRAIVPNVKTQGYRVLGFAPDIELEEGKGPFPGQRHYSCVHAVDGQLSRIILGDSTNRVEVREVDLSKTTDRHE